MLRWRYFPEEETAAKASQREKADESDRDGGRSPGRVYGDAAIGWEVAIGQTRGRGDAVTRGWCRGEDEGYVIQGVFKPKLLRMGSLRERIDRGFGVWETLTAGEAMLI